MAEADPRTRPPISPAPSGNPTVPSPPLSAPTGPVAPSKVLSVMLERLFAAIAGGPSLNCRPHSSRQRIDLSALQSLGDITPGAALTSLLSEAAQSRLVARVKIPPPPGPTGEQESPDLRDHRDRYASQQQLISKLRILVDEARTYEEDTGVHVLNVGFPLLHLPPGIGGRRGATGRRVIAPVAFIPVSLTVQGGAAPAVDIACQSDEVDRIVPNEALLAWIEQQTGKAATEINADDDGSNPWREVSAIVRHVCNAMEIATPEAFATETSPASLGLLAVPKTDDFGSSSAILMSAVLGLFPASKQGLIRDTKDLVKAGAPAGPIKRFLSAAAAFESTVTSPTTPARPDPRHTISSDSARLVAPADPCQASAVAKARAEDALVIHGPPGTGKSQTITNIIGDSLVRGQRVLFVCEKRTALDVVANRLQGIGLGDLCALIHDPQRDQKNLYMSIREQLDGLAEKQPRDGIERTLERLDAELIRIHAELTEFRALLNTRDVEGRSLHELVGRVLELTSAAASCPIDIPAIPGIGPEVVEAAAVDIRETLSRGVEVNYIANPWSEAASLSLAAYLALPGDRIRQKMDAIVAAARAADATIDPRIPAFAPAVPLPDQATARAALADEIDRVYALPRPHTRRYWASRPKAECLSAARMLSEIEPLVSKASEGPLDAELLMTVQTAPPNVAQLAQSIGALEAYLASTKSIFAFLAFGKRKAAAQVLSPLGLPVAPDAAERAKTFLSRLRALIVIRATLDQMGESAAHAPGIPPRDATLADATSTMAVVRVLTRVHEDPKLAPVAALIAPALVRESPDADLLWGLRASPKRASSLEALEAAVTSSGLIALAWATAAAGRWRNAEPAAPTADALSGRLPTLEGVLRVREGVNTIRAELRPQIIRLLEAGAADDAGIDALLLATTTGRVAAIIESSPKLHAADARRVQTLFTRWRELEAQRRETVRDLVVSKWLAKQRSRLVVGTGSRLNSDGAKVRQRLITRGARALRLRQVLALGREVEGGDPILDLRPVWMASPETVAQVFPREPIFDVVVFDEASQCRLEDALPVLTRAKRVVIAGDPKQLPPTRFFESGAATSDDDPIATDDQLFEAQQTQVEDLLSAALNLALAESYLDVHYRSRNSDLIEFSNEHFYSKRLQAIPGHPRNRTRVPPLNIWRVDGVYKDRQNEREADEVVKIVRDLLKRAEPPSIGIACFNLTQRDLIVEKLDQAAETDQAFAARLAIARSRRAGGAPDGLFVKNLENVQGDERDHIIISTTYGRDPGGKFHRRFGPLLQPGGGRRLNVLVTRAREEIHLVTSIPRDAYLSLPEVPMGQTPGGGWLLLSYLRYAEDLRESYSKISDALDAEAAAHSGAITQRIVQPSTAPSAIALELGAIFERENATGSVVHWGNDGFCIDVALRHASRPLDVTCGILCDFARYAPGQDAIEWDIFRTGILEAQGWHLERLWSPAIFRDPKGCIDRVLAAADRIGRNEHKSDQIRVVKNEDDEPIDPPPNS
jgi:hypothetical protein